MMLGGLELWRVSSLSRQNILIVPSSATVFSKDSYSSCIYQRGSIFMRVYIYPYITYGGGGENSVLYIKEQPIFLCYLPNRQTLIMWWIAVQGIDFSKWNLILVSDRQLHWGPCFLFMRIAILNWTSDLLNPTSCFWQWSAPWENPSGGQIWNNLIHWGVFSPVLASVCQTLKHKAFLFYFTKTV